MNKKRILVPALIILTSVFVVFTAVTALAVSKRTDDVKAVTENYEFYRESMRKAGTKKQKDAIGKIMLRKSEKVDSIGYWKRDILMILGELPKDQKRLEIEQAKSIIKEKMNKDNIIDSYEDVINSFNAIAGAPDHVGGSGLTNMIYFLDDEQTEAIVCSSICSFVHAIFGENDEIVSVERIEY
jgi:hypothetical protein